ncbi:MAG: hypothetical protein AAF986_08530, partial [Pseudomonadota bacterium]
MTRWLSEFRQSFEDVAGDSGDSRAKNRAAQRLISQQLSCRLKEPITHALREPESRWAPRNPIFGILSGNAIRRHFKDAFWDGLAALTASTMLFYGLSLYGLSPLVAFAVSFAPFALYAAALGLSVFSNTFPRDVEERLEATYTALKTFERDQRALDRAFSTNEDTNANIAESSREALAKLSAGFFTLYIDYSTRFGVNEVKR